ncbi:MAG: aldehyde dehydrogenase family protein, partial [Chromatiales bacterium]
MPVTRERPMVHATAVPAFSVNQKVTSIIAGEAIAAARSGFDLQVICPATEEPASLLREADPDEVELAIAAARDAFDYGPWPRMDINDRNDILHAIRDRLRAHAEELAWLEVLNTGIPLTH